MRWIIVAIVAAIALGGLAVALLWPSSDGAVDEPSASITPTTLDTLPPAVTTPSATSPPITTSPPRTTETGRVEATLPAVVAVDVPNEVASDVASHVVALTSRDQLVSLDTMTGTATTVDLELASGRLQQFGTDVLVASPDAVMLSTSAGSILVVENGSDTPISIDRDDFIFDSATTPAQIVPFGWIRTADGGFEFVVIVVDQSTGNQREWLVDTEGNVALALAQRSGNYSTPIFAQGTRFLNDAGGAYRVDLDGSTQRVSSGTIIASSANRILLRECDAQRFCSSVLRDHDGGNVASVDLPATFLPTFFGASLAPDSSALTTPNQTFNGDRTLFDLANGTATTYAGQTLGSFGNTWAADSSGEFSLTTDAGLVFLDRATGDEVAFGEELGDLQAIAVRSPGVG